MPTLPNQSAPSAYFSPAKVTRCTVRHITAHSLAARREEKKKIKRCQTTISSDKYVNYRREEKCL